MTDDTPIDSGAGESTTPLGADPVGSEGPDGAATTPSPTSLQDDSLIAWQGVNGGKPIALGDAFKGFQSQFTKASQKAADLERRLAERDARLSALEDQRLKAAQSTQTGDVNQALAALEQLPYVSGQQQKQLVLGVASALKQRDQVITGLYQEVQRMKGYLNTLVGDHSTSTFNAKIGQFVKNAGIPDALTDHVKELYLAYEGDDLDQEFPTILQNWYSNITKALETHRRTQVQAAKRLPWVPGKGGNTGPHAPMKLTGKESPRDIANQVWEAMNAEVGT